MVDRLDTWAPGVIRRLEGSGDTWISGYPLARSRLQGAALLKSANVKAVHMLETP